MELEIKPYALSEIEKVRAAFEGRQFGIRQIAVTAGLPRHMAA